jgi:hypothetical protein
MKFGEAFRATVRVHGVWSVSIDFSKSDADARCSGQMKFDGAFRAV